MTKRIGLWKKISYSLPLLIYNAGGWGLATTGFETRKAAALAEFAREEADKNFIGRTIGNVLPYFVTSGDLKNNAGLTVHRHIQPGDIENAQYFGDVLGIAGAETGIATMLGLAWLWSRPNRRRDN